MNNIIIADKSAFKEKKEKISTGGKESFHVVSDFDRTLTSEFVDGKRISSIISLLRDSKILKKDYEKKAHELFNKYHPIEMDLNIPIDKKKVVMHEWWMTHFDLLIKSGLNKKDLIDVIKKNKIKFRDGALEFIDILNKKSIPLVIFSSSGLGDSISMLLDNKRRLYNNVHIITNLFEWDKNGNAVKIKKPIIHSMNKDEHSIKNYPVFDLIRKRKNILLLGDTLGDLGMVKGFDYENLINIGFLNDKIKENLNSYKSNFDVVITDDFGMHFVDEMISEMF